MFFSKPHRVQSLLHLSLQSLCFLKALSETQCNVLSMSDQFNFFSAYIIFKVSTTVLYYYMISGKVNYLFSHIYLILRPGNTLFSFSFTTDLKKVIPLKESLFCEVQIAHRLPAHNSEFSFLFFLTFAILLYLHSNRFLV